MFVLHLKIEMLTAVSIALSRLASLKTRKGSDPPNSRTQGLNWLPANWPIFSTGTLPVKDTPATLLCEINADVSVSVGMMQSMMGWLFGQHLINSNAILYVLNAGFIAHVFPTLIVGTINRISCHNGKFQGMIPKTTPIGDRNPFSSLNLNLILVIVQHKNNSTLCISELLLMIR